MRSNKYFKYSNYHDVVSNCVPNRCYSIGELLARVMRGQPLPMVPPQYEEQNALSEEEIDAQIDSFESHPMFDRSADIIEAKNALDSIDDKLKRSKVSVNTKKKKNEKEGNK